VSNRLTFAAIVLVTGAVAVFSGAHAGDDSMTTTHFIAYRSANPHSCQDDIAMMAMTGSTGCPPSSMLKPNDDQVLQVVD
jgi:hypothetical protein